MRILFVENHGVFAATVVSRFLADHEVAIAPSVADAFEALRHTSFDVILLDYDLDNEKGDVLMRRLNAERRAIPVVAVSARPEGNEALMRAGAIAACPKGNFNNIARVLARVTTSES